MAESDKISDVDERMNKIFLKVGRNVVNLQRLEARLKGLQSTYINAPLSRLSEAIERRRETIARRTLGPLTHEAVDNLFPEESRQGEFAELITETWLTYAVCIEDGCEVQIGMRAQLKKLVDDRNQLIHHMFGGFDPRFADGCSTLESKLDEQFVRISEVFRWLEGLFETVRIHAAELEKHADEILPPG